MVKQRLNVALKMAILQSGKKQRRIATLTRIPEAQLSHYVQGKRTPSDDERERIAKVLGRQESELFPTEAA